MWLVSCLFGLYSGKLRHVFILARPLNEDCKTVWGVFFLSEFGKFLSGYVKNKSGIVEREKSKCFMKLLSFNHKQGPNFCNYWGRKSALLA